jgi:hypothetical protein
VRRAHHDAVLVRELRVQRVVVAKGAVPHRRPEVVGLQAQQQLEDLRVELVVVAAELLPRPAGERGRLVVDEDAAVLHGRLTLHVAAGPYEELRARRGRHVGPPVPGRDAYLFGEFVEAVDGAALVAAGDDERALDAGPGPLDDLRDARLPEPAQALHFKLARACQLVYQAAPAERADDDDVVRGFDLLADAQVGRPVRHALDVCLKVVRGAQHAGVVPRVQKNRRGDAGRDEPERAPRGCELDVSLPAERPRRRRADERAQQRAEQAQPSRPVFDSLVRLHLTVVRDREGSDADTRL